MSDGILAQVIWQKSSYSAANGGSDQCVEVGQTPTLVALRDSKDPSGPVLTVTPAAWDSFIRGLAAGDFNRL
jgi:hypothetical protein